MMSMSKRTMFPNRRAQTLYKRGGGSWRGGDVPGSVRALSCTIQTNCLYRQLFGGGKRKSATRRFVVHKIDRKTKRKTKYHCVFLCWISVVIGFNIFLVQVIYVDALEFKFSTHFSFRGHPSFYFSQRKRFVLFNENNTSLIFLL